MLYNRWGDVCEVEADCGLHDVAGFRTAVRLVAVRYVDTDHTAYVFAHTLRADDGIREVDYFLQRVPRRRLCPSLLERAIRMAL